MSSPRSAPKTSIRNSLNLKDSSIRGSLMMDPRDRDPEEAMMRIRLLIGSCGLTFDSELKELASRFVDDSRPWLISVNKIIIY